MAEGPGDEWHLQAARSEFERRQQGGPVMTRHVHQRREGRRIARPQERGQRRKRSAACDWSEWKSSRRIRAGTAGLLGFAKTAKLESNPIGYLTGEFTHG